MEYVVTAGSGAFSPVLIDGSVDNLLPRTQ